MRRDWLWIGILLGLLWACDPGEPVHRVDLTERETPQAAPASAAVTYAYLPQYSHAVSYQKHHLLVVHLRRETGLDIRQIFPDTFDGHLEMVGQGKIDLSFTNPYIYVQMARRYGAAAFARIVEAAGGDRYRGQVICRADDPRLGSLADCRGKRWIAVDPGSGGGSTPRSSPPFAGPCSGWTGTCPRTARSSTGPGFCGWSPRKTATTIRCARRPVPWKRAAAAERRVFREANPLSAALPGAEGPAVPLGVSRLGRDRIRLSVHRKPTAAAGSI